MIKGTILNLPAIRRTGSDLLEVRSEINRSNNRFMSAKGSFKGWVEVSRWSSTGARSSVMEMLPAACDSPTLIDLVWVVVFVENFI